MSSSRAEQGIFVLPFLFLSCVSSFQLLFNDTEDLLGFQANILFEAVAFFALSEEFVGKLECREDGDFLG